ncbi:hypothetical protein V8E54_012789 [Elaphomyces granulatus]
MPVEIHDCHQEWYHDSEDLWFVSGLLTLDGKMHLRARVGTTIEFIHGPYADSRKEPNLLIRADNLRLPKVVIEVQITFLCAQTCHLNLAIGASIGGASLRGQLQPKEIYVTRRSWRHSTSGC